MNMRYLMYIIYILYICFRKAPCLQYIWYTPYRTEDLCYPTSRGNSWIPLSVHKIDIFLTHPHSRPVKELTVFSRKSKYSMQLNIIFNWNPTNTGRPLEGISYYQEPDKSIGLSICHMFNPCQFGIALHERILWMDVYMNTVSTAYCYRVSCPRGWKLLTIKKEGKYPSDSLSK